MRLRGAGSSFSWVCCQRAAVGSRIMPNFSALIAICIRTPCRIKWIHQDGAVELLPPENPDEIFARKVDNLRAQEAKEKAEAEAKEKSMRAGDSFLWKDGVDAVRGATHHAQQLSNFLGLLSKKVLALSSIAPSNSAGYAHSEFIAIEAKLLSLSRACTSIMEARDRLVLERKVDAKFGENLMALCTNWNVRPILKSTSSVPQAGPLGSLAVSLSLHMSESPDLEYMLLLRCQDGSLQVRVSIFLYVCPHTTIHFPSYYYMCVCMLLFTCLR